MATTAPDTCADITVWRTASTTPSKLADSPATGDCTTAVASSRAGAEPAAGPNKPAITAKPNRYAFSIPFLLIDLATRGIRTPWLPAIPSCII